MNVLRLREGAPHRFVTRKVRHQTKLDLAVIRGEQNVGVVLCYEGPANPASELAAYFDALRAAAPPAPAAGDWTSWIDLLGQTDEDDPHHAMAVTGIDGFGTVSSTLLALPAEHSEAPVLLFANGPPGTAPYEPIRSPWVRVAHVEGR